MGVKNGQKWGQKWSLFGHFSGVGRKMAKNGQKMSKNQGSGNQGEGENGQKWPFSEGSGSLFGQNTALSAGFRHL